MKLQLIPTNIQLFSRIFTNRAAAGRGVSPRTSKPLHESTRIMSIKLFDFIFLFAMSLVFLVLPLIASAGEILCKSNIGGHCLNLAAAAGTVPGLEFLGPINTPGELFAKLYTFGISFVGLAAFFMFTYGAILYMAAGEGNLAKAKKAMTDALYGLVIALTSFLLLNIINPDLVKGTIVNLPKLTTPGGTNVASPGGSACGSGSCSAGDICVNTETGPACQPQASASTPGASQPGATQILCGSGTCSPGNVCAATATGPACFPPGSTPSNATVIIPNTTFPMSQPSGPPDPQMQQACRNAGRVAERAPTAIGGTKCVTYCLARNETPRNPTCLD